MEPWQEEALRQLQISRLPRPQCVLCEDTIYTEYCLDLKAFGLPGLVCERCVDRNMRAAPDCGQ